MLEARRSARCRGCGRCSSSPPDGARRRRRSPWLVDLLLALDRQLTHIEQNLSHYFSPNTHLLGEALALYVAGRVAAELAASERRAATGRRILVARDRAADRRRRRALRALDALSPLHAGLLPPRAGIVARITGDPAAHRFRSGRRAAGPRGAPARRRAEAPPAHRRRRWRDAAADLTGRAAGRHPRQPRGRRRARRSARLCGSAPLRKKRSGCSAHPQLHEALARRRPRRRRRWRPLRRAGRHRLLRVANGRRRSPRHRRADRTATRTAVMPTPTRCR